MEPAPTKSEIMETAKASPFAPDIRSAEAVAREALFELYRCVRFVAPTSPSYIAAVKRAEEVLGIK